MTSKIYKIFISSTYDDLKDERSGAINTILQKGYMPVCMEFLSAANKTVKEYIYSQIDDCDYFILILGDYYGSIDPKSKGKSYTQLEFEHAIKKKIPTLRFILKKGCSETKKLSEEDNEKKEKLATFKKEITKDEHLCKTDINPEKLNTEILSSIVSAIQEEKRPAGWIKYQAYKDNISKEINNTINNLIKGTTNEDNKFSSEKGTIYNSIGYHIIGKDITNESESETTTPKNKIDIDIKEILKIIGDTFNDGFFKRNGLKDKLQEEIRKKKNIERSISLPYVVVEKLLEKYKNEYKFIEEDDNKQYKEDKKNKLYSLTPFGKLLYKLLCDIDN